MTRYIYTVFAAILTWVAANASGGELASGFTFTSEGVVTVADSVTVIPPYIFADRHDLVRVEFGVGSALREVGEYAFMGCTGLKELHLPAGVKVLGEGCLRECESLRRFEVPAGVEALPRYLFAWDTALEEVSLPAGLKDIGAHAFVYCSALRRVEIPAGVEHIGSNAFSCCSALEKVSVPDSVTELESYAFAECTSLREARLPGNDSLLGELIFSGCRLLGSLYEPSAAPPPFDCDSSIFEPDEIELYARCRLYIPDGAEDAYASAPGWKRFFCLNRRD